MLDADGNGAVAPQTDGRLILRHLFGFSGAALTDGVLGTGATRNAAAIRTYLNGLESTLDVDGDGRRDALTDGLLIWRYLFGRTDTALTQGAIAPGATRTSAAAIQQYLAPLVALPPVVAGQLNDTGITTCSDEGENDLACPVSGYPWQDAQDGRDATNNDDSDGHAGFSFTKLDSSGNPLPASANAWSCVSDNVTGLTWEVKTTSGLRSQSNTYSWYNPDVNTNGGSAGAQNRGSCTGSDCDTQGFVAAVNAQGLCGHRDWRLPSRFELMSIVSNDRWYPAIVTAWFSDTDSLGGWFWSSSPGARDPDLAWGVNFGDGGVNYLNMYSAGYVRLVCGGQ